MTDLAISRLLEIRKGTTCLIGGGGKTTLLYTLAQELQKQGKVIVGTTTKIYKPAHIPVLLSPAPEELAHRLRQSSLVCVGQQTENGKLTACAIPVSELQNQADYVLLEADGSAGLPMKAHLSHEPVIPEETDQVILVVGASGFQKPIEKAAHRARRYAQLCGARESDPITPALAAAVIKAEQLHNKIFVNQVDTEDLRLHTRQLAELLDCPITAGSLQKGRYICLRL